MARDRLRGPLVVHAGGAPALRRERHASDTSRSEGTDPDELRHRPERDVLDSPSDSWRDVEFLEMLDEIGRSPEERVEP